MTESGSRDEGSMSNASQGAGEVNYMQAVVATATEIEIRDGQSAKGSRENSQTHWMGAYICGLILNSSMKEVLKCQQAGCKTQWVSTLYYEPWFIL